MKSATRLYILLSDLIDREAVVKALPGLLRSADVAAVLLQLPATDPRAQIERIKAFTAIAQAADAALIVADHLDLVARGGADGAQVSHIKHLPDAIGQLKPQRIVGAAGLATRHDAMVAGEGGADYVLFGEPGRDGTRPTLDAVVERVAWWSEIFEIPCVAYAATPDETVALARAGADFVMIEPFSQANALSPERAILDAAEAIGHSLRPAEAS